MKREGSARDSDDTRRERGERRDRENRKDDSGDREDDREDDRDAIRRGREKERDSYRRGRDLVEGDRVEVRDRDKERGAGRERERGREREYPEKEREREHIGARGAEDRMRDPAGYGSGGVINARNVDFNPDAGTGYGEPDPAIGYEDRADRRGGLTGGPYSDLPRGEAYPRADQRSRAFDRTLPRQHFPASGGGPFHTVRNFAGGVDGHGFPHGNLHYSNNVGNSNISSNYIPKFNANINANNNKYGNAAFGNKNQLVLPTPILPFGPAGGGLGLSGGIGGRGNLSARQNPPAVSFRPPIVVDREKTCPLLIRVFTKVGAHHPLTDFEVRGEEPKEDEVQIYTWKDATLRELTDLVKEVSPQARRRDSRLSFAFVYPNRLGRNVMKNVGITFAYGKRVPEEFKTLHELGFQTGDLLDVAIFC